MAQMDGLPAPPLVTLPVTEQSQQPRPRASPQNGDAAVSTRSPRHSQRQHNRHHGNSEQRQSRSQALQADEPPAHRPQSQLNSSSAYSAASTTTTAAAGAAASPVATTHTAAAAAAAAEPFPEFVVIQLPWTSGVALPAPGSASMHSAGALPASMPPQ